MGNVGSCFYNKVSAYIFLNVRKPSRNKLLPLFTLPGDRFAFLLYFSCVMFLVTDTPAKQGTA